MATKKSVEKLFKYLNNPQVLDVLNKRDNKQSDYIKRILEQGEEKYYNDMKYGAPDDKCAISKKLNLSI